MASIFECVENREREEDFELETNRNPDEIDSDDKTEDIQRRPEEFTPKVS